MKKSFVVLTFIYSLALLGCGLLAPSPDVKTPERFPSNNDKTSIDNMAYLAWWREFNDESLNALIKKGLSNNMDIQIANANLEQAQGQLRQVELSWIPFVNVMGGFGQNPALGAPGLFYGVFPQYFVNLMKLPSTQRQANYNLSLQKAQIDAVKLTLIGQIVFGYFTYLAELEQLKLLQNLEQDLNTLARIKKQAFEGGIGDEQSVEITKNRVMQVRAQSQIVKRNIVASQNALRYLLNDNPGIIATKNNFETLDENMVEPGALPANVLANRPDLLVAQMKVEIAGEGVYVSAGDLFPVIQLDKFVGPMSGSGKWGGTTIYGQFSDAYLNWQITPSVLGEIEARQGSYKAATYNYIKTVRQILRDVDNDFATNTYYRQKLSDERSSYRHLQKEYKLQENLYKNHIISYAKLIESKLRLDDIALSVNQSKLQYLLSEVLLYQDLAGGYKYEESNQSRTKPNV